MSNKNRNRKLLYLGIVAFLFIGLTSLFILQRTTKENGSVDLVAVSTRIKWFPYASYIGTYAALDYGYFEKNGLSVSIYEGGPQVDATKLVAAGSNDFGICGGDQLIVARSKGLPVVAIAALMQETPAGFMVLEESDIKSMRDFPGHRIRIIPGHNTEIEYRAVMAKLGISTESIEEIVSFSELQLLTTNQVDIEPIYLNNQPSKAKSLGIKFRTFTPSDYGTRSYGNVYFTTEKMIEENPERVYSFISAVLQGWEQVRRTPEAAVDSLIQHAPSLVREVEIDKLKATWPLMDRSDKKIGWMEAARWDSLVSMLVTTKVIESRPQTSELFDNSFMERYYDR